jgi:hypothetical protein
MSSNNERGVKACNAMKTLGFNRAKARKVVKRLFKLFDDNWEPIEEDNYRILIDAMLEDGNNEPMPATTSQVRTNASFQFCVPPTLTTA